MFWNKKNKNKSHIKREWSAEIGKLNYKIENTWDVNIDMSVVANKYENFMNEVCK